MIIAEVRASKDGILVHKLLLPNDLDLFIKRLIIFFNKKTDKTAVYHSDGHCSSKVEQIIALIIGQIKSYDLKRGH